MYAHQNQNKEEYVNINARQGNTFILKQNINTI